MSSFPQAQPHGAIEEIFANVFEVRGSFRIAPLVSIRRNMVVVREGDGLTVINAVRLSAAGEQALEQLGTVRNLVRLGFFHSLDDPYYRSRFAPKCWSVVPDDAHAERLIDGGASPLERAKVFSFKQCSRGEAALVVTQPEGDLLVTCDSVQHWPDTAGCSAVGGLVCRTMGFLSEPAKIGSIWLKESTGGDPRKMLPDFERLLSHDFAHMMSAHGDLLRKDARREIERSCEKILRAR